MSSGWCFHVKVQSVLRVRVLHRHIDIQSSGMSSFSLIEQFLELCPQDRSWSPRCCIRREMCAVE